MLLAREARYVIAPDVVVEVVDEDDFEQAATTTIAAQATSTRERIIEYSLEVTRKLIYGFFDALPFSAR